MVCGCRAYDYLCAIFEQNRAVSQAFSAQPLQTGEAAAKMNETLAALKFRCAGLEMQLYDAIANSYVNRKDVLIIDDTIPSPRELADRIAKVCTGYAAVFAGRDSSGYNFCIISRNTDLRPMGKALTAALNGRGGGKPECQQGSIKATRSEIEAFFANMGSN
jgi:alanyl-tRNA synthetase